MTDSPARPDPKTGQLKRVPLSWRISGIVVWTFVVLLGAGIAVGIFYFLDKFKHSAAYELTVAKLEASPVATGALGSPISAGFPFGKISITDASGKAELNFSATGPKAAGTVFVEAVKKDGVWSITRLSLKLDGSDKEIDLLGGAKGGTT
jgi:Cytochrome oxidase complex assembly protein 1